MPITVACPHCRASIKAGSKYAGRQVACPHCKKPFTVPTTAPPAIVLPPPQQVPFAVPVATTAAVPFAQSIAPRQTVVDSPAGSTSDSGENLVWEGRPSQITNLRSFIFSGVFCWLIFPVFTAAWRWLRVYCTYYKLTTQRYIVTRGILSRRVDELELYRVKDTSLEQTLFLRIFSRANIQLTTSDASTPHVTIEAIPYRDATHLRETLRALVERARDRKRVREVDYN